MKKKMHFLLFFVLLISLAPAAHAHCPLCTAAVGAAAVSAKYYGMDTSVIGLLVGAFAISIGLWIGLKIKEQYFRFQLSIIVILSFVFTVVPLLAIDNDYAYLPLLLFGKAGSIFNKAYFVNKMLFGSIIGAFITAFAYLLHIRIKKLNGRVLFPFQGVVITVLFLAVTTAMMYLAFRI